MDRRAYAGMLFINEEGTENGGLLQLSRTAATTEANITVKAGGVLSWSGPPPPIDQAHITLYCAVYGIDDGQALLRRQRHGQPHEDRRARQRRAGHFTAREKLTGMRVGA